MLSLPGERCFYITSFISVFGIDKIKLFLLSWFIFNMFHAIRNSSVVITFFISTEYRFLKDVMNLWVSLDNVSFILIFNVINLGLVLLSFGLFGYYLNSLANFYKEPTLHGLFSLFLLFLFC